MEKVVKKKCVFCGKLNHSSSKFCISCKLPFSNLIKAPFPQTTRITKVDIKTGFLIILSKYRKWILIPISYLKLYINTIYSVSVNFIRAIFMFFKRIFSEVLEKYLLPTKTFLFGFIFLVIFALIVNKAVVYDRYLSVKTIPEGADVFIENIKIGISPVTNFLTKKKKANLEINKLKTVKGYMPQTHPVKINEDRVFLEYNLEKEKYPVDIITDPPGAIAKISDSEENELFENLTPTKVDLEHGIYNLKLEKQGYIPMNTTIEVDYKEVTIKRSLNKPIKYGGVNLKLSIGVSVFIDGRSFGSVAKERKIRIAEGRHIITLKKDTEILYEKEIIIVENIYLDIDLKFGVLNISAHPWAYLYIDGRLFGELTPMTEEIILPEGSYSILLKKGEEQRKKQVVITPNNPVNIHEIFK